MEKKVLVVGAGLGGLAAALRLAKKGYRVQVVEKNAQAGGRLNRLEKDGFIFDTGPSFFSMSYEFLRFAEDCSVRLPFTYFALDPLYTVNFSGSPPTYFLYRDIKKLASQFSDVEPDFEKKMNRYLDRSQKLFHDTVDLVIKNNFDSFFAYLFTLMRVNPVHLPVIFRSFWQEVCRNFSSAQARQIISLVAFFLGRTPFDTMAVYTLLSYTEFRYDGYYNVEGGMYKIVEGLVSELKKEKVPVVYNTEIVDYAGNAETLEVLIDRNGNRWQADMVVINADAAVFRGAVFGRKKYSVQNLDKMNWTMGYLTFYLGIKCKLPQINHHNYYLGSNFEAYANNVVQDPASLQKPYYYVNVLSRHNRQCAPQGCESLFFVCPVPNLLYKPDWNDRDVIVDSIIADFSKRIKKDIGPEIISRTIYTPLEWQNKFNLHRGSGLGLTHSMGQIGAFRPANVDERFRNVFYVGASTVPGTGLPMVIISSKLTVERIEKLAGR